MSRKTRAAQRAKPAKEVEVPVTYELGRKTGRKWVMGDFETAKSILGGLGAIMATWKECAAVLQISEATLMRIFHRWPEVKNAYDMGKAGGRVGLRRSQFKLADRNATMAIFLGMNYLEQKDMRNVQHGGEVKHSHEHTVIGMMLKEIDEEARSAPSLELSANKGQAA